MAGLIGLSIHLCFRDMATREINPELVEKIIARTACSEPEHWDFIIGTYKEKHWLGFEDEAEKLVREFLAAGKIEQPRLTMGTYADLKASGGHWVKSEEEIVYFPR